MKKFFRMALVFALAGATLMYTGCTKDYGEEIDNLDGKLSALQQDLTNKVNDLSSEVSSLRSAVSGLESAYKAADDLIKGDVAALDGRVKKLEDAVKDLSKYATKDELKAATDALEQKIKDAKDEITKTTDDLQKQINELKEKLAANEEAVKKLEAAQKEVDAVYGFLSDELRSIVFYPDFYFAGIEATSYDFASYYGWETYYATNAMGQPIEVTVQEESGEGENAKPKIVFSKKAPIYYDYLIYVDAAGNYLWKFDDEGNIVLKDGKPVADKNGDYWYFKDHIDGQIGKAFYDLNPSSFPLDSAEWSLNGDNKRYVVKSEDEEPTWSPVFESISKNDGHAEVLYSIENPDLIFATVVNAFPFVKEEAEDDNNGRLDNPKFNAAKAKVDQDNNVPIMQLVGTLSDGREIVSDWHAVASGEEFVDHLAFGKNNMYKTTWSCELTGEGSPKVLYWGGRYAALNVPSVPVKYNGGPFNLAEIISIHTVPVTTAEAKEYTLAEFNAKYPGYTYKFTEVPYTIGANKTSEDMYGKLDGDNFIPCYVKSEGGNKYEEVPIEKDSEDGISAVGRMPIILVELVDADGYTYAFGWFKIIITKDEKQPQERTFEIPGLTKVPFICSDFTLATTWDEFSYFVLENLKMDYEEFLKTYTFTGIWGQRAVLSDDGKSVVTKLAELVPATAGTAVDVKFTQYRMKDGAPVQDVKKDYGTALYKQDKAGSGINDAFEWQVDPRGIGEGKSNTIYFRFENGEYDIVYFAMTADVAKKPGLTFVGNKLANEWFNDITDDIDINTARMNVPVPTADKTSPVIGGDVKLFQRDINHYFQGYKPELYLSEDSDPVYANYFAKPAKAAYPAAELATTTKFQFAQNQPAIAGLQLFTNYWEDSMTLYAYHYNMMPWGPVLATQKVTYQGKEIEVPAQIDTIATIVVDGKDEKTGLDIYLLKYYDGAVAKELLNLWSYTETDEAKMLYANILAKNSYGACNIGLPDGNFHVRFIRPLDVDFAEQDVAEESAVDGNNVELAKFISGITDWNKQSVIIKEMVYDSKTKKDVWTGYYVENVIKTVNMYKYYRFSKLRINLGKVERNNWDPADPNKWASLAEKTPGAKLQLGTIDLTKDEKDQVFTPTTITPTTDAQGNVIYEMPIENFNDLKGAVLNYRNDEAFIGAFTMRIPVELDYAWGTLTAYLVINVKDTGSTTPSSL